MSTNRPPSNPPTYGHRQGWSDADDTWDEKNRLRVFAALTDEWQTISEIAARSGANRMDATRILCRMSGWGEIAWKLIKLPGKYNPQNQYRRKHENRP